MSVYFDDLCEKIDDRLAVSFSQRDGQVIPSTSSVALKDGAVKLEATFLYADLAGSSALSQVCPWQTTAKIIKRYLYVCSRLITAWGGEIRSFDGDRVMGIFIGETPSNNAVKCAREIDYTIFKALDPKAKSQFKSVRENGINIRHCVGIDHGESRAVRGGIRDSNDLLWIGKPPSFAAKLSDIRDYPREVYISSRVYSRLNADQKIVDGKNIWTSESFDFAGKSETVYSTTTVKEP